MAKKDIVVIGASAGGVEAILALANQLPRNLDASVFVVLHSSAFNSNLPSLLSRNNNLPAEFARNGERFYPGKIYVAPSDHHLILEPGVMRVIQGPKENLSRPSIDVLFRSAAVTYKSRVIGVVLTGLLDDGSAGLHAIKSNGGVAIIQDPQEALYPEMPLNALRIVDVDHILPLIQIGPELVRLTSDETGGQISPQSTSDPEILLSKMDTDVMHNEDRHGVPSVYSCPACNGVLWEIKEGKLVRLRCRVGHAYSPDSFMEEQKQKLEQALWTALTTLEERASISRQLAEKARIDGYRNIVQLYQQREIESQEKAEAIRSLLLRKEPDEEEEIPAQSAKASKKKAAASRP